MSEFDKKAGDWDSLEKIKLASALSSKILEKVELRNNVRMLEFGAGTGLLGLNFADKVGHITFLDSSSGMLSVLKEKLKQLSVVNAAVVCSDILSSFPNAAVFDIIISSMVLHHIDDTEKAIEKLFSLLAVEGVLVLVDLVSEDGSFHGEGFSGHCGFNRNELAGLIESRNMEVLVNDIILEIKKNEQYYPLFLIVAKRM